LTQRKKKDAKNFDILELIFSAPLRRDSGEAWLQMRLGLAQDETPRKKVLAGNPARLSKGSNSPPHNL
jgi:hypothetical protein